MRGRWTRQSAYFLPAISWLSIATGLALGQTGPPRLLAPGVLRVISSNAQIAESFTGPEKMVELTEHKIIDWMPHFAPQTQTVYDKAQRIILRREIWNLEFAFKPLRVMTIEVPQPSGKMQRKVVWYMVYRIRYLGSNISASKQPDGTYLPFVSEHKDGRYFLPQFLLTTHELKKTYMDQPIPIALDPISLRERPDGPLHDSVTIASKPIPLNRDSDSAGVWGVAMWQDVDPRIDFLTVDIKGLTNAYIPSDPAGEFQDGDKPGKGRQLQSKTLRLHFWKPGDTTDEPEDVVRFGVPVDEDPLLQQEILTIYGVKTRVDYEWVYR